LNGYILHTQSADLKTAGANYYWQPPAWMPHLCQILQSTFDAELKLHPVPHKNAAVSSEIAVLLSMLLSQCDE